MADQEETVFLYVGTYADEPTAHSDYELVQALQPHIQRLDRLRAGEVLTVVIDGAHRQAHMPRQTFS